LGMFTMDEGSEPRDRAMRKKSRLRPMAMAR
jgi:hypothetical protein